MQGAVASHSGAGLASERVQALSQSSVVIKGTILASLPCCCFMLLHLYEYPFPLCSTSNNL